MKDIVDRLRTAMRHRNLYKEHILVVAADEIERLRKDRHAALTRIEELEKDRDSYHEIEIDEEGQPTNLHIITTDQIDAAWAYIAHKDLRGSSYWGAIKTLEKLGIERCEGCEASLKPGTVFKMDMGERGYITDCPDCDGKGWVKK